MQHQDAGLGASVDEDTDRGQAGIAGKRMAERIAELAVASGVDVMAIGGAELRLAEGVASGGVRILHEEARIADADRQREVGADAGEEVTRPRVGLVLADRLAVDGDAAPAAEAMGVARVIAGELVARPGALVALADVVLAD